MSHASSTPQPALVMGLQPNSGVPLSSAQAPAEGAVAGAPHAGSVGMPPLPPLPPVLLLLLPPCAPEPPCAPLAPVFVLVLVVPPVAPPVPPVLLPLVESSVSVAHAMAATVTAPSPITSVQWFTAPAYTVLGPSRYVGWGSIESDVVS